MRALVLRERGEGMRALVLPLRFSSTLGMRALVLRERGEGMRGLVLPLRFEV
jgi:hypothetical protein